MKPADMLPASPADLFAYLDSLGIVHQTSHGEVQIKG
jgi:hypothetical protein